MRKSYLCRWPNGYLGIVTAVDEEELLETLGDDAKDVEYVLFDKPVVIGLGTPGDALFSHLEGTPEIIADEAEVLGSCLKPDLVELGASMDFERNVANLAYPRIAPFATFLADEMRTRIPFLREVTDLDVAVANMLSKGTIDPSASDISSEKVLDGMRKFVEDTSVAPNPMLLERLREAAKTNLSDIEWGRPIHNPA